MAFHWLTSLLLAYERRLVDLILARPGFHHAVRRVHRKVEDIRYGRDPSEPLRQGEATEPQKRGFLSYFFEELQNQARGTPTNPPPPPRPPTMPK